MSGYHIGTRDGDRGEIKDLCNPDPSYEDLKKYISGSLGLAAPLNVDECMFDAYVDDDALCTGELINGLGTSVLDYLGFNVSGFIDATVRGHIVLVRYGDRPLTPAMVEALNFLVDWLDKKGHYPTFKTEIEERHYRALFGSKATEKTRRKYEKEKEKTADKEEDESSSESSEEESSSACDSDSSHSNSSEEEK